MALPTIGHLLTEGRPGGQQPGGRLGDGLLGQAAATSTTAAREAREHAEAATAGIEPSLAPTVGIGIVGCGYWGPNLIRNFSLTPGARVVAVCDLQEERLAPIRAQYPAVRTTTSF